jgi:hypothetical protein
VAEPKIPLAPRCCNRASARSTAKVIQSSPRPGSVRPGPPLEACRSRGRLSWKQWWARGDSNARRIAAVKRVRVKDYRARCSSPQIALSGPDSLRNIW